MNYLGPKGGGALELDVGVVLQLSEIQRDASGHSERVDDDSVAFTHVGVVGVVSSESALVTTLPE